MAGEKVYHKKTKENSKVQILVVFSFFRKTFKI